ncbi:NADH-quinone oxidoreductase subunit M [Mangrovitalea sediminis]|uniref:NADH-quinone oxidoreductase subunit M n=1 Tax=Mangrovitalea sediminis TaxID=1982043 RepID=UPI000BE60E8D|nr:NADH-quinone oxidoreductase subunit M [Mangrovitalea sediminis]
MILPWLILIPFIGGLLCWQGERFGLGVPRWVALFTMALVFVLSLILWSQGDYSLATLTQHGAAHWQSEFQVPWISRFGISFHLGLDGLSLLMVMLTGLLGVMAVICSWKEISDHIGFFHLNLLWSLGGVIGVFLALDMFLFFTFWELMLVPTYFLIALWGHNPPTGKGRIHAAMKFIIYTQTSGLILLLAILGLVFVHFQGTGQLSFDYGDLLGTKMSPHVEYMLMLGFFIAFAVKLPVVPFHSWLPDAHSLAPTAGSVDLAGLLLKTAGYGLLRFSLPFFPHASHEFAPIAMWLGVISIFYGAILAFAQTDIKRLIAYTSISHMGFVLIAIYAGTHIALQGAVLQMVAHGISAGALFILSGEIYERLKTRDMRQMSGLWSRFSYLPPLSMFFAVASLGLPGMGNFVGEFLILLGSFPVAPVVTVVAAGGLIMAAVYGLILIQRALHGPAHSPEKLKDLNMREIAMMLSLVAILLYLGLYPQSVLDTSSGAMAGVQHWYSTALSAPQNIAQ